ncbi:MAG: ABC transporter, partial [Chloroflexi bacterium]
EAAPAKAPPERSRPEGPRKLSWKEQREVESLEARIAQLEERKLALAQAMNDCGDDYVRLQSLAEQLETTGGELDDALARWFELAEIAGQS